MGLATPDELGHVAEDDDEEEQETRRGMFAEEPAHVLTLAEKLRLLFRHDFPAVDDVRLNPVWAAGELLEHGGNFQAYVTSNRLQKQEGIIFRHLLRLILLIAEFRPLCPPDAEPEEWETEMDTLTRQLVTTCRTVDPTSTDKALQEVISEGDVE